MKINFEIDCTPEEARKFFGLPDVKPLQDAVMAKLEQRVVDAVSATTPEAILKAWFPFTVPGAEQAQEAFTRFFAGAFGSTQRKPE